MHGHRLLRATLLALLLVGGACAAFVVGDGVPGRGTAWPLFVAGYALGTLVFVPKPALSAAAGAAFGIGPGLAVAAAGTTLGALAAFATGRFALRPLLPRHGVVAALERRLSERAFTGVLVLRLLPVVPFAAVNLGAAACRVGWLPFAAATLLGTVPGNAAAVLAGAAAASPSSPALWLAAAAGLAVTGAAAVWRRARPRARAAGRSAAATRAD
ncbi:VTT domain-containing protein [Streptomyces sp. MP131-18]|uniref:VTT domain-containing protein n=1 Tax=Streptomyces sp. MP131-18 TaxID=1857892 RepID=UPI00209B0344|nr:VTT domain-containing protein [Streptomyces sp. MP131-18]